MVGKVLYDGRAGYNIPSFFNELLRDIGRSAITTTEDIKKIQKRRGELEQQGKDLRSQIRVSEYNNITEN